MTVRPIYMQNLGVTAQLDRIGINAGFQEGVFKATDFDVSIDSGLIMDIASGTAIIEGDTITNQGKYTVYSDATEQITLTTADGSNPRIDQIYLEVTDGYVLGTSINVATVKKINGTPAASAQCTNPAAANYRDGAAALPQNSIRLADIRVPASASTPDQVQDRRPWARGAFHTISHAADYSRASSTIAKIDSVNLSPLIELTGVPVLVRFSPGYIHHSIGSTQVSGGELDLMDNGVAINQRRAVVPDDAGNATSAQRLGFSFEWLLSTPSAALHSLAPGWGMTIGPNGTINIEGNTNTKNILIIQEIVKQNTSND